ncbi:hypothetical protein ACH5RR_032591 [Cinchona calisaya]|uniref:Uncharacterized protein n=1 Tax=Cinchona calisaya TaxID=153742 RepID=A0ABD2YII1_9GENT
MKVEDQDVAKGNEGSGKSIQNPGKVPVSLVEVVPLAELDVEKELTATIPPSVTEEMVVILSHLYLAEDLDAIKRGTGGLTCFVNFHKDEFAWTLNSNDQHIHAVLAEIMSMSLAFPFTAKERRDQGCIMDQVEHQMVLYTLFESGKVVSSLPIRVGRCSVLDDKANAMPDGLNILHGQ